LKLAEQIILRLHDLAIYSVLDKNNDV